MRQPLQADHLTKEIKLAIIGFGEFAQDHACRTIEGTGRTEVVKGWRHHAQNIIRETGGSGEIELPTRIMEVLGPQKDEYALGGELVLPQLDAGVLQVFRQLGEHQGAVA